MRRLAPLFVAGAALLVACGSQREAGTTVASRTAAVRQGAPAPDLALPRAQAVQVTVVDGDTNARVRGARVTIGRHSARSDHHGVAFVPLPHRAALVTSAAKSGYAEHTVRLSFRTRPKSTIRIYRRSLQWAMYGANPARSQAQPSLGVRPPFRVVWSRGLGTLIEFPAVVQDGVAYIANARGTARALDMRNGDAIWRHDMPHGKMASSPAVWRGRLIVHGMDGRVRILRRSDGRLLWQYTVGSPVESSPVIVDGADVFGAWNGTITALDLGTHRVRWRFEDGCKVTSSAAFAGSTLYIGDYCGRLVALRATGSYVYSSPAVADGRVFFGSYNGVFYALSARTGATLWTHATGGPVSGAATVVDGVAYAGSFAHRIVGVDVRSGRVVLDFPHGEYVPVSGSGRRLLLHGYSRIYAVVRR